MLIDMRRVLVQATRLARAMVTRYGMSDVLGKVSVNYDDMGQSLSSETRAQVENEVRAACNGPHVLLASCCSRHQSCCSHSALP
jgi:ATP-dependent metalloprotease